MAEFNNDRGRSIDHRCSNGTVFKARADLQGEVIAYVESHVVTHQLMADAGQFIAFHVQWILPTLNGFPGYDTVKYVIKPIHELDAEEATG